MKPPTPGARSVLSGHERGEIRVRGAIVGGGLKGWLWLELIHSTCTTSAHNTNKQGEMVGLVKNAQSGPIIDTVHVGGFCRLKLDDGWMHSRGLRGGGGGGEVNTPDGGQLRRKTHHKKKKK